MSRKSPMMHILVASVFLLGLASGAFAQAKVDPSLPAYRAVPGIAGTIKSIGSDTMNNLMTLWAEGFGHFYPGVQVEVEGKGSSTAPPALVAGTANFGPMSREMKSKEIDEFERRFGYKPVGLRTGIDMLVVFVNKDNPLGSLTFPEVDAIFSRSNRLGHRGQVRLWGDLNLGTEWAYKPISPYGRNAASGTYTYFKENVLSNGDFKDSVKEQPGSSAVVQGVASDRFGIGYTGMGYLTADVRALSLRKKAGGEAIPPSQERALSGEYPLARFLLLYVNHKPGTELDPLRREFVRYIFSRQGQEVVIKDGYLPVSAEIARNSLQSLGIEPGF